MSRHLVKVVKVYVEKKHKKPSAKDIYFSLYILFFVGLLSQRKKEGAKDRLFFFEKQFDHPELFAQAKEIYFRGLSADVNLLEEYLKQFSSYLYKEKKCNAFFEQLYQFFKYDMSFFHHICFKRIMKFLQIRCSLYDEVYDVKFNEIHQAYEVLSCSLDASLEQIQKSYRKKALFFHPDQAPEKKKSCYTEKFQEIQNAYLLIQKNF